MKRIMLLTGAVGLVFGLYGHAISHEGAHKTLMGTIHALVESEIIVVTQDGKYEPVALRPSTRYVTTRDEKGSWEELRDGMRVVIKLNVQGKAADEVRYQRAPRNEGHEGAGDDASK